MSGAGTVLAFPARKPLEDCPRCFGTGCYSEHVQQPDGHYTFVVTLKCECERHILADVAQCGILIEDIFSKEQLARQVRATSRTICELQEENRRFKQELDSIRFGP